MSIFYDETFEIQEAAGTKINLTFQTKALENGRGNEERVIEWNSPLLSFDLSKAVFGHKTRDYVFNFFQALRGSTNKFRYRDCTDYEATATIKSNKYGSTTQGRLSPAADGTRTEFQLFKVYSVGNNHHFRAITRPSEIRIYENGSEVTDWSEDTGKIVFINPPTGELTADIIFDVPVSLSESKITFKVRVESGNDSLFGLESLTLEEIREEPFENLIDNFGELPEFTLLKFKGARSALIDETEIIDLSSGFDKRTSIYPYEKIDFSLPTANFGREELEHLITFWRCCKGRGLSFPVYDPIHTNDYLMMRFADDSLALGIAPNDNFKIHPTRLIEVFEGVPVSLRYVNNPNAGAEQAISGGNGNYLSSEAATTVNTSPTLGNIGSSGGSGGNGDFVSTSGTIIAISEIQGKLVIFTFKNLGSQSVYRLFIETQPGNLDFEVKYSLASLDTDYSVNDFVNISESRKGIVLTTQTLDETVNLYALSIDENGIVTEEFQPTSTEEGVSIFYTYYSTKGATVYVSTFATTTVYYSDQALGCLNWAASGMLVQSCISFGDNDYRMGNRNYQGSTLTFDSFAFGDHRHCFINGEIVFMGGGENSYLSNATNIEGTSYHDYEGTNQYLNWIATVNGVFSGTVQNGQNVGYTVTVEEQDNIKFPIYSDNQTTIIQYNNVPGEGDITVTQQGYKVHNILIGVVGTGNEFISLIVKENDSYDPTTFKTYEYAICSITEPATLVTPTNLEDLGLTEFALGGFLSGSRLKKYKDRFYSGQQGVHYLKESGELGIISHDFSLMPDQPATAIYTSETRGLVLAYESLLRYLVITEN